MKKNKIIDLYSRAFFDLCYETDKTLENSLNNINELLTIFQAEDNLIWNWLIHLNDNDLRALITNTFTSRVDPYFLNFLNILFDDRFFYCLLFILKKLKKLIFQKLNFKFAKIYSKVQLNNEQLSRIHKILTQFFNSKIEIIALLDAKLIGGIRLETDEFVFDNSLLKKIRNLGQNLLFLDT